MMQAFGNYVLRKQHHAIVLIVACTVIPLMGWLASVVVGLITLCQSVRESVIALAALVLTNAAYGYWMLSQHGGSWSITLVTFIHSAVLGGVLVWCAGLLLRHYRYNWTMVLLLILALSLPILCVASTYLPVMTVSIIQWVHSNVQHVTEATKVILTAQQSAQIAQIESRLYQALLTPALAEYVIGCMIILVLCTASAGQLLIARWWQSYVSVERICLKEELTTIRIPWVFSALFVITMVAFFTIGSPILYGVLPIVSLAWLIAGLSVVHALVQHRQLGWLWLLVVYIGLFAVNKVMFPLLSLAACVDSMVNLRQRFAPILSDKER